MTLEDSLRALVREELARALAENATPPEPAVEYETECEAAARMRMHGRTLRELRLTGKGPPYIRAGGRRVIYRRAAVDEWLAARTLGR